MEENSRKLTPSEAVVSYGDVAYSKDAVSITFETVDGTEVPLGFKISDVPGIVATLIQLAQRGAQLGGTLHRPLPGEKLSATPIEAIALGAISGRENNEAYLAVHTGVFALAFAVPPGEFETLQQEVHSLGINRRQ